MADQSIYDPAFVRDVFDRCSGKYIAFSTFFSFGFTERWRRQCVEALALPRSSTASGYDLMAGTGEVWPHLLAANPAIEKIVAVDVSRGMHERAMTRLHAMRSHRIEFIEDDALASALPPQSADFIISTFGLKTFNPDQHRRLAKLTAEVLRPGGKFAYIEASEPKPWLLRILYMFHLRHFLPLIERLFLRGAQDFAMIGTYTRNFGDAGAFAQMLRDEGLECEFSRRFFGCATVASGSKPC